MDFDRDKQASPGNPASTGDRSTTGDPSSTGTPSTPRDQATSGSTQRSGSFDDASPAAGSTQDSSFRSTTGPSQPGPFGDTPDDTGTRAGSYDRKFSGEEHDVKESINEKVDEGRDRLSGAVDAGRNRVAGQLERIGDRLEERGRDMEQAGGVQQRAGQVALRAGEALDSSAQYLRSHEPNEMRDDLERSIRERPLLSIGIAAGAGFLLARLLRD
jgi:ElaB/YqjD/DUF883 family membrane-anchored ribosome-binding protein